MIADINGAFQALFFGQNIRDNQGLASSGKKTSWRQSIVDRTDSKVEAVARSGIIVEVCLHLKLIDCIGHRESIHRVFAAAY